jgi:hypothetical protein
MRIVSTLQQGGFPNAPEIMVQGSSNRGAKVEEIPPRH